MGIRRVKVLGFTGFDPTASSETVDDRSGEETWTQESPKSLDPKSEEPIL